MFQILLLYVWSVDRFPHSAFDPRRSTTADLVYQARFSKWQMEISRVDVKHGEALSGMLLVGVVQTEDTYLTNGPVFSIVIIFRNAGSATRIEHNDF